MSTPQTSTQVRIARAVLPYIGTVPVAALSELGIRTERVWRQVIDSEMAVAAALVGTRTQARRRLHKERAEATAFRTEPARGQGRRPVVNWHEGGTGPALLLLNGWTASGLVWPAKWIADLERSFRVIRIDNRGTGWSRSAPAPFTVADMADDARDVLRACGVERATVLGLSMGGMIAQELALRHPSYVERLVLVATMPPMPAQIRPDPAPFLAGLGGPKQGQDLHGYIAELWGGFGGPDFVTDQADALEEIVATTVRRVTPRQLMIAQARAIGCWRGSARLSRVSCPTIVVHGTSDAVIPVGNGMRLARLIPDARYVELPGVGHLVPQQAPADLLRLL
jgi:pimeloyl-ACP methyl ester carboxylesterase